MTGDIMNRILYIKSEAVRRLIPKAEKILSGERLERFRALKRENDKLDSLAASALLEQALDGRIDLYYKDENGCPRLSNGKFLSISSDVDITVIHGARRIRIPAGGERILLTESLEEVSNETI